MRHATDRMRHAAAIYLVAYRENTPLFKRNYRRNCPFSPLGKALLSSPRAEFFWRMYLRLGGLPPFLNVFREVPA